MTRVSLVTNCLKVFIDNRKGDIMFRYVTKVNYVYGTVDGKVVSVKKTVYRHDRFKGLLDSSWHFIVSVLFPICYAVGIVAFVGVAVCYLMRVW